MGRRRGHPHHRFRVWRRQSGWQAQGRWQHGDLPVVADAAGIKKNQLEVEAVGARTPGTTKAGRRGSAHLCCPDCPGEVPGGEV